MSVKTKQQNIWNLPNALTILRLCLVPVYGVVFFLGHKYPALIIFLTASLTDMLDGIIARRCNLVTDFGKLMDPLADKIMVLAAMLSMTVGNPPAISPVIPWPAVAVVLVKEGVMVWGGLALYRHGIVTFSSLIGKTAHTFFIAGLIASYFHDEIKAALPGWSITPDLLLVWAAVVLTLCAMVYYIMLGLRRARDAGVLKRPFSKT